MLGVVAAAEDSSSTNLDTVYKEPGLIIFEDREQFITWHKTESHRFKLYGIYDLSLRGLPISLKDIYRTPAQLDTFTPKEEG